MTSQCEFGELNFAGTGGGGAGPGGDVDVFGAAGGKGTEIQNCGGAGIEEEAHVGAVDGDANDGEYIAFFDGDFVGGWGWRSGVLCAKDGSDGEAHEREEKGVCKESAKSVHCAPTNMISPMRRGGRRYFPFSNFTCCPCAVRLRAAGLGGAADPDAGGGGFAEVDG